MIPPLSTTPSAPTITRSTFSNTYLWKQIKTNKWVYNGQMWHLVLSPLIVTIFTPQLHPGLQLLGHWVFPGLLPSVAWTQKGFNTCLPTELNKDSVHWQYSLTRLSQAVTQSRRQRSASSRLRPFPAPWGQLWSTSESGFSGRGTQGRVGELPRCAWRAHCEAAHFSARLSKDLGIAGQLKAYRRIMRTCSVSGQVSDLLSVQELMLWMMLKLGFFLDVSKAFVRVHGNVYLNKTLFIHLPSVHTDAASISSTGLTFEIIDKMI